MNKKFILMSSNVYFYVAFLHNVLRFSERAATIGYKNEYSSAYILEKMKFESFTCNG